MTDRTDQKLVADLVSGVLRAHQRADLDDAALWTQLEELGLTLAAMPESLGGAGGSMAEVLTILRVAAAHGVSLPLLETGMLAGGLLAAARLSAVQGPMAIAPTGFDERIRARRRHGVAWLSGESRRTPYAPSATCFVISARDDNGAPLVARVASDVAGVAVVPETSRAGYGRVTLSDARAEAITVDEDAGPEQMLRRAALGRCVMIVGALSTVRDLTVRHASERAQFGRPLRSFQAVEHQLAVLSRERALAAAVTDAATSTLLAGGSLSLVDVAAAKVTCGKAAATVSAIAHQLHGAVGITREHPLSRFTTLLGWWRADYGGERAWAEALGGELGRGDAWRTIAGSFSPSPRPAAVARTVAVGRR